MAGSSLAGIVNIKEIGMALAGLLAGGAVSAGVFAIINAIGVAPRLTGKTATAAHIYLYETMIMVGLTLGNIVSIDYLADLPFGIWFLVLSGIGMGCFIGCMAVSLAEVLQVFPVVFRRLRIKSGLGIAMICLALGKVLGALYAFLFLK